MITTLFNKNKAFIIPPVYYVPCFFKIAFFRAYFANVFTLWVISKTFLMVSVLVSLMQNSLA